MKIRYLTVLCYLYRKLIVVTLNLTKYLFCYNYFFFYYNDFLYTLLFTYNSYTDKL